MSASVSAMPGGQPSITQPIAGPWLSPKVVTRNRWPKVLWDMLFAEMRFRARGQTHDSRVRMFVAHRVRGRKAQIVRPDHARGQMHGSRSRHRGVKRIEETADTLVHHRLAFAAGPRKCQGSSR